MKRSKEKVKPAVGCFLFFLSEIELDDCDHVQSCLKRLYPDVHGRVKRTFDNRTSGTMLRHMLSNENRKKKWKLKWIQHNGGRLWMKQTSTNKQTNNQTDGQTNKQTDRRQKEWNFVWSAKIRVWNWFLLIRLSMHMNFQTISIRRYAKKQREKEAFLVCIIPLEEKKEGSAWFIKKTNRYTCHLWNSGREREYIIQFLLKCMHFYGRIPIENVMQV